MIVRAGERHGSPGLARRAVGAIGSAVLASGREILLTAALAMTVLLTVLQRGAWRGPVWSEHVRMLHEVTVRTLSTTIAAGVLVGIALVSQAVYWLAATGATGLVGPVIVLLLIREFTPILVGLILFGRAGTATLIELHDARTRGWQRLIEMQGLDPLVLLVLPRAISFAVGAFCLATILLLTTLATGYLAAHAFGLIAYSVWDFAALIIRGLTIDDFIVPPFKCVLIGFMVALACCATGLGSRGSRDDLGRIVPLGFVRSALAILLVNTLVDLVV